jgi:hypothetical protein
MTTTNVGETTEAGASFVYDSSANFTDNWGEPYAPKYRKGVSVRTVLFGIITLLAGLSAILFSFGIGQYVPIQVAFLVIIGLILLFLGLVNIFSKRD